MFVVYSFDSDVWHLEKLSWFWRLWYALKICSNDFDF